MKQFTHRNEGFVCQHCGQEVPDAESTCRNHCTECLHSLHVDVNPGDRAAKCQGDMIPIDINFKGGLPISITHKCVRCGLVGNNKIATDDNRESMIKIIEKKAYM